MPTDFYCYVLFDWLGVPRYVGKGRGDRWLHHEQKSDPINWLKNEFIEHTWLMLGEIPKVKMREGLTELEAFEIESALIKAIGRFPDGPLTNMTDGGEGSSGYRHSLQQKQLISDSVSMTILTRYTPKERSLRAKKRFDSLTLEQQKAWIHAGINIMKQDGRIAIRNQTRWARITLKEREEHCQKMRDAITPAIITKRGKAIAMSYAKKRVSKQCLYCSTAFAVKPSEDDRKYCSWKCFQRSINHTTRLGPPLNETIGSQE